MRKSAYFLLAVGYLCLPLIAHADPITLDVGDFGTNTSYGSRLVQIMAMVTILSLAPSIIIMVTSFTRVVVVLSFVRSALGLQQTPPNAVLISLAIFLTGFIMAPTFEKSYIDGISPLIEESMNEKEAFPKIIDPFKHFMLKHVREKDLELFMTMGNQDVESVEQTPLPVLIPAFMISELRRAFEIGFLVFIPFIIIDMLVASILMAMGMMMLPPIMVSLPFKIIFFVMIDGWYVLCGSLIKSF